MRRPLRIGLVLASIAGVARAQPAVHAMDDMPGMAMPIAGAGPLAPVGQATPPPPADHAADRYYAPERMAESRHALRAEQGGGFFTMVMFNLAEYQVRRNRDGFRWDGQGWIGGDIDKLWFKAEGDGDVGRGVGSAEVQALYSRAVGPYADLQAGIRYDLEPSPSRTYAAVGFEPLLPYRFDAEGALFLSNKGDLLARLEGYYDQHVTQRLVLQPRVELNFAAQDVRETGTGAGLSEAELGLRLRYEIRREFAPYIGVSWDHRLGHAAGFAHDDGDEAGLLSFVAGIRFWF